MLFHTDNRNFFYQIFNFGLILLSISKYIAYQICSMVWLTVFTKKF